MWEHFCDRHQKDSGEVQLEHEAFDQHPVDALTSQLEEAFRIFLLILLRKTNGYAWQIEG